MRIIAAVLAFSSAGCSTPQTEWRSDFPIMLSSGETVDLRAGMRPDEVNAVVGQTLFQAMNMSSMLEECWTPSGQSITLWYEVDKRDAEFASHARLKYWLAR